MISFTRLYHVLSQICIFSIIFFHSIFAQEADTRLLSLQEALQLGEKSGYEIQIAREKYSESSGKNLESWSGFLPGITFSENYIQSTDPVTVFGNKLKQGVFSEQDFSIHSLNFPEKFENYMTSIQIKQPLLNVDAIFGKSATALIVKSEKQSVERIRQALMYRIKLTYSALILSNENIIAIEQAIESAKAHRNNAKAGIEQGMVTQADYLATEVRLSELKEQRILAINGIHDISNRLKILLGLSDEEKLIVPTDSLFISDVPSYPDDLHPLISKRSDLVSLQFQKKAAQRELWMSRSFWFPRLNGFYIREWNARKPFRDDNNNWTLGIQLSWNIFDGLGHWGRRKQKMARADLAGIQLKKAHHKARVEIDEAKREIEAAKQRLEAARLGVRQAAESLHLINERYEEGLEKVTDVLDREVMYTQSKLRFLRAKHDYVVSIDKFKFRLGTD